MSNKNMQNHVRPFVMAYNDFINEINMNTYLNIIIYHYARKENIHEEG